LFRNSRGRTLFEMVMRPRLFIASLALLCALVAGAASAGAAKPTTQLKVRDCQVGDSPKQRSATFYARMTATNATSQMAMRFTLIDRAGDGPPTVVANPALARWRRSNAGVKRFGYAQSVAGLQQGGIYAVQVQFRWMNAHGQVIRSVKRTSGTCRQNGKLPNLSITAVSAQAGETSGTEIYTVDLTNSGRGRAHFAGVDIFIDGAAADGQTVDLVKPGETKKVRFTGPVCRNSLKMVADRAHKLKETNEDDNTLRARCPVLGG
jgi:archaellum component FlaF (FlaF/FlaG flagellin family)